MNNQLPVCTVGYPLHGEDVLLGLKADTPKAVKRKINGYWLGSGGDFEADDQTLRQSFSRELFDETKIRVEPKDVEIVAKILIKDENGERLWLYYTLCRCAGEIPTPNREFAEFRWFLKSALPEKILGADKLILPRVFSGEKLEGWVRYDTDMNVVDYELKAVASVSEALE